MCDKKNQHIDQKDDEIDPQEMLVNSINAMRENPDLYHELRGRVKSAKTVEDRVQTLLQFATTEQDLSALIPEGLGSTQVHPTVTVTITIVFWPSTAEAPERPRDADPT